MSRFKPGDVVELRSGRYGGAQPMTVLGLHEMKETDSVQIYDVCSMSKDGSNLFTCALPEFVFCKDPLLAISGEDAS